MVTREDVINIAKLAKLSIDENELDSLTREMANIIKFADTINTAGESDIEFDNINNLSNVFREDIIEPSYEREQILKNASSSEEGFFAVSKRG